MTAATQAPLGRAEYGNLVERVRALVGDTVPPGAVVAVVSRGDPGLVELEGRRGWHFPRAESGVYAGHHPADSADAIAQLEALRDQGAGFLLVPATAFWWFDHYVDFKRHLDGRYRLLVHDDQLCALYSLAGQADEESDPDGFGPLRRQELARQIEEVVWATLPEDATVHDLAALEAGELDADGFLLVPATEFAWLDERPRLRRELEARYRLVVEQRHLCRIYELSGASARRRRFSMLRWLRRG